VLDIFCFRWVGEVRKLRSPLEGHDFILVSGCGEMRGREAEAPGAKRFSFVPGLGPQVYSFVLCSYRWQLHRGHGWLIGCARPFCRLRVDGRALAFVLCCVPGSTDSPR
jgi:hypothetical protein